LGWLLPAVLLHQPLLLQQPMQLHLLARVWPAAMRAEQQQLLLLVSLVLLAGPMQAPLLSVALAPVLLLMLFHPLPLPLPLPMLLLLAEATTLVPLLLLPQSLLQLSLLLVLKLVVATRQLLLLLVLLLLEVVPDVHLLLLQQQQLVAAMQLLPRCWLLLEAVLPRQVLLLYCPAGMYCLLHPPAQVSHVLLRLLPLLPARACCHCWLVVRPCTASEGNAVQRMAACCWSCLLLCRMLVLQKQHQQQHHHRLPQLNPDQTRLLQRLLLLPRMLGV
jgi:hypothetical protein